jgi:arylsulfatase A-like enzyme
VTRREGILVGAALGLASGVVGGTALAALFSRPLLIAYPFSALVHGVVGALGAGSLVAILSLLLSPSWSVAIGGGAWVAGTLLLILGYWLNKVLLSGIPYSSPTSLAVDGAALVVTLVVGLGIGVALRRRVETGFRHRRGWTSRLLIGALVVLSGVPAVLVVGLAATGSGSGKADAGAPSVLLVSFDTCRADRLGCYGDVRAKTPVIDRLAAEGVRFRSAYCPIPSTSPSHASMLTGLLPQSHEVRANTDVLKGSVETLAEVFSEAGYVTGGFTTNVLLGSQFGFDQGFQTYVESGHVERLGSWNLGLLFQALISKEVIDAFLADRGGEAPTVLSAKKWLSKVGDRPFFLFFHLLDPHTPYTPPEPYRSMIAPEQEVSPNSFYVQNGGDPKTLARTESLYEGEVATADAKLGRLMAHLHSIGRDRNLLVVFTADHGENLGDHPPHFAHQDLFDSVLRVPLVFAYPGRLPAGAAVGGMVDNKDIVPTVLAIVGLAAPHGTQGRDLLPAIRGQALPPDAPFLAYFGKRYALLAGDRKFVMNLKTGETRLFDLAEDPGERDNLVQSGREAVSTIEQELMEEIGRVETEDYLEADETSRLEALDRQTKERLRALGYID